MTTGVNLTCPLCHGHFDLAAVIEDEAARSALKQIMNAHPLRTELIQYIGLWRAPKTGKTTWVKVAKALEILTPIIARKLTHKHRTVSAPIDVWRTALGQVLHKAHTGTLDLPISNNNYLYTVVIGEGKTHAANAEEAAHDAARTGQHRQTNTASDASKDHAQSVGNLMRQHWDRELGLHASAKSNGGTSDE